MTITMTPSLRKFALTPHIASSVGLLGSIAAFLALALAGLTSQDAQLVRAVYLAMDLTARFVILPLAFASLLTGFIQSLGTQWGLFRHYWVLAKLLLTAFATIILMVKMELVGYAARLAAETICLMPICAQRGYNSQSTPPADCWCCSSPRYSLFTSRGA